MFKTDLIEKVASNAGVDAKVAAAVINATLETIAATVAGGDKVTLTGFGTFAVTETKARKGLNPRTKEPLDIPAGKRMTFKASKKIAL